MDKKSVDTIRGKLKAPIIALERVVKEGKLPKVFAVVALDELREADKLAEEVCRSKK